MVELAESIGTAGGMIGCRMTGGGFGGCAVSLVRTDAVEAVMQSLDKGYRARTRIEAFMFVSRPADGAQVLPQP